MKQIFSLLLILTVANCNMTNKKGKIDASSNQIIAKKVFKAFQDNQYDLVYYSFSDFLKSKITKDQLETLWTEITYNKKVETSDEINVSHTNAAELIFQFFYVDSIKYTLQLAFDEGEIAGIYIRQIPIE